MCVNTLSTCSRDAALTKVVSVGDYEGEVDGTGILFVQDLVQVLLLRAPEPFEFRVRCPVGF